jgi:hypothetical protein
MSQKNNKTIKLKNYNFINVITLFLILSIFYVLLYFILLKLFNHQSSIYIVVFISIASFFLILLSWKEVLIHTNYIEVITVFTNKKMIFNLDEVFMKSYYPPSATWSSEKMQIRVLKSNKLIIEFNKESNVKIIKYLKNDLNVKILK